MSEELKTLKMFLIIVFGNVFNLYNAFSAFIEFGIYSSFDAVPINSIILLPRVTLIEILLKALIISPLTHLSELLYSLIKKLIKLS